MNKPFIAYAAAWLATGIAVSVAVIATREPGALWALLIPCFISVESKRSEDE